MFTDYKQRLIYHYLKAEITLALCIYGECSIELLLEMF